MDGSSAPVRVIARLVAQPDKVEQLRALLARAGAVSRTYSQCRAWNLLRNRANPREFVSISDWVDEAAYEARMRDPEWIDMTSRLPDLIEGEIGFEMYHVIV
jgi:quinol monooxygenase YgiN